MRRIPFRRLQLAPTALILLLISSGYALAATCLQDMNTATKTASGLDQIFQTALDVMRNEYGFPGATAAYAVQDGRTGIVATGMADLEAETPMTVGSRMLAASIGKTFVGATTLALAREGVVDLDAPVSTWLGDRHWFPRLPNHDTITLRHLLTHGSGLPDHVHMQNFADAVSRKWREKRNPFPPEALIQFVLDQPPLFEAGRGWAYSDTGYILIGLVIEAVTGRRFYDEVKERFLEPLDLALTSPSDRRDLPGLAAGYTALDNAFGLPGKTITANGLLAWHPGFEWTGGGLVSNAGDLARWGVALFGGSAMAGGYLVDLLQAVPVSRETPDIQYGAGVGIYGAGPLGPVYGHGGWIPGYCSSLRYYPDHGVAIAFQINTDRGVLDDDRPVVREMETRLAEIVTSELNARQRGARH